MNVLNSYNLDTGVDGLMRELLAEVSTVAHSTRRFTCSLTEGARNKEE